MSKGAVDFATEDYPKRYIVYIAGENFDVTVSAPDDEDLWEEAVALSAKMACADWNRRRSARHCGEHDWDDRFQLDADIWGEDVWDSICKKCGVFSSSWERQKREEHL
jgi:hypothetical protein